jgi:hypothetical protein
MTEATEAPITQDEMIKMFGEAMPVEAAILLWNSPPDWTIGQVRAKLRVIAGALSAPIAAGGGEATAHVKGAEDEFRIEWAGGVHISIDRDEVGYAFESADKFTPGAFSIIDQPVEAAKEIEAFLAGAALSPCRIGEETEEAPAELSAGLCPRCAGTGRDPSTTSLQCYKCMGQGAVVLRASLSRKTAGEAEPIGWVQPDFAEKLKRVGLVYAYAEKTPDRADFVPLFASPPLPDTEETANG